MFSSEDELASDLLSSRLFGIVYFFEVPHETEGEMYFLFCYIFLSTCTHTHTWFESMVERNIFSTNSATDDKILELMLFRNYLI